MLEKMEKYIIWVAGLSFFPKLIISIVIVLLAFLVLMAIWQPSRFGIRDYQDKTNRLSEVKKSSAKKTTSQKGIISFDYSTNDGKLKIGEFPYDFETQWTKASDDSIHIYNDPPSIESIGLASGKASFAEIREINNIDFSSRVQTPQEGDFIVLKNKRGFYAAFRIIDIKDSSRSDTIDEVKFEYRILNDRSSDFALAE